MSVITPVHNGAEFLGECIRSVLSQTFSDWEYIIVDNVSTDGTAEVAERFAQQDSRVRVIRATEFVDLYTNHNRALREMDPSTRYCKFVHADDWLYPECLEKMVAVGERNPSVGLVGAYRLLGTRVDMDGLFEYSQEILPGRDVVRRVVLGTMFDWVTGSPTSTLLRTDLVRQEPNFYNPRVWHADTESAYRMLTKSDMGFVHQVLTFTREHPGAMTAFTHRVWTFLPFEGRLLTQLGPQVLSSSEYRHAMRRWLWRYSRWLGKELVRPSRQKQQEFHDFHRGEIDFMLECAGDDRETHAILLLCKRMLRGPRAV